MAFAYYGGKNSEFSPFKAQNQGEGFFGGAFFFFPLVSACITLHVMVAFRFAWMICDSTYIYKTVLSLSHVTVLGETVNKSFFSSQFLQPEEKNAFFFVTQRYVPAKQTSSEWTTGWFWIDLIEDSAKSSSAKSRILLQITERTTKLRTTR